MQNSAVRVDKWLWAARFFKTRGLAKDAVEGGKVHVDGARAKPSRQVLVGMVLRIRAGHTEKIVRVAALSEKRGPAREAQTLYEETPESIQQREHETQLRRQARPVNVASAGKPDKKDRRDLRRLKTQGMDR